MKEKFDYFLWTTEEGKHMAYVKRTGEVTEISHEVKAFLEAERKKEKRDEEKYGQDISLNEFASIETGELLLRNSRNYLDELFYRIIIEEFRNLLTPRQLDVFESCMLRGVPAREYAKKIGVSHTAINLTVQAIRKKYSIFYF